MGKKCLQWQQLGKKCQRHFMYSLKIIFEIIAWDNHFRYNSKNFNDDEAGCIELGCYDLMHVESKPDQLKGLYSLSFMKWALEGHKNIIISLIFTLQIPDLISLIWGREPLEY